jgi:cytochrome c oxidase subunit 5b
MFLQRSAVAAARRVAPRAIARRTFTTTFVRRRSRLESATMYH